MEGGVFLKIGSVDEVWGIIEFKGCWNDTKNILVKLWEDLWVTYTATRLYLAAYMYQRFSLDVRVITELQRVERNRENI